MKKRSIAQLAAVVAVLLLTAGVGAALSLGSQQHRYGCWPGPGEARTGRPRHAAGPAADALREPA